MTHLITFVLDETGSMQSRKEVTISGFNEWMQEMEKFPGEVLLNLIKFNSDKHELLIKQAVLGLTKPRLTKESYLPAALTPLLDAVGRAIRETDSQLENLPEDTDVVLVILTDGQENASTEFSLEAIKALIAEKEKAGWAITYMGDSADAWMGAQTMGVSVGATMNFMGDNQSSQQAFLSNAIAVSRYMGGGSSAGGIYSEAGVTDEHGQLITKDVVPDLTVTDEHDQLITGNDVFDLTGSPTVESDEDDDENELSED